MKQLSQGGAGSLRLMLRSTIVLLTVLHIGANPF